MPSFLPHTVSNPILSQFTPISLSLDSQHITLYAPISLQAITYHSKILLPYSHATTPSATTTKIYTITISTHTHTHTSTITTHPLTPRHPLTQTHPKINSANPLDRWVVTHSLADSNLHGHRPAVYTNQQPCTTYPYSKNISHWDIASSAYQNEPTNNLNRSTHHYKFGITHTSIQHTAQNH